MRCVANCKDMRVALPLSDKLSRSYSLSSILITSFTCKEVVNVVLVPVTVAEPELILTVPDIATNVSLLI